MKEITTNITLLLLQGDGREGGKLILGLGQEDKFSRKNFKS